MRRLALLILLAMEASPADAQAPNPPPSGPVYDIRDFGARPSTVAGNDYEPVATARACRKAIQAAIDLAGSRGVGRVYVPVGVWPLDKPLRLDRSSGRWARVAIAGEGPGLSTLRVRKGQGSDAIVLGMDRAPWVGLTPTPLDPACLVPLDAILDGSAPGRKGFRTFGKAHLAQQGGHFDRAADWYAGVRILTVDLAFVAPDNVATLSLPICGLRVAGQPSPWYLSLNQGRPVLETRCVGDPDDWENGVYRSELFVATCRPGLNRLTIEWDLDGAAARCRLNGQQARYYHLAGPAPAATDRFFPNQHSPFRIGSISPTINGSNEVGSVADITVCGLKVSRERQYNPDWTRLDGKPDSDLARYFDESTKGLVGLLALNDDPADAADRLLTTRGPGGEGYPNDCGLYALEPALHGGPWVTGTVGRISGLSIDGGDGRHGSAIAVESAYGVDIRDCELRGGSHGIGWFTGANPSYPVMVRDAVLSGSESPLMLANCPQSTVRDVRIDSPGYRSAVRASGCNGVLIDGFFAPHGGTPEFLFCLRGTAATIRRAGADAEGAGQGSQRADVYITPGQDRQGVSGLTIDGLGLSAAGPNAPVVVLGAPPGVTGKNGLMGDGPVRVDGLSLNLNFPRVAQVKVTPKAAGIWRDGGIRLSPSCPWPAFAGPALTAATTTVSPR